MTGLAGPAGPAGSAAGADAGERLARAALTRIAEPGTTALVRAADRLGAAAVWAAVRGEAGAPDLDADLLELLRKHPAEFPPERDLELAAGLGARFICPQDDEWPAGLAVLGGEEPLALWVRGELLLSEAFDRAVAVVGARAATAYGGRVASE
ncbi:MAG: processing protein, partial [Frankiales bacterium]|nr:processing protein [Frankiales bacterium]